MFNHLANYLLGMTGQETVTGATDVRLTAVVADDDWVLVDRDSDGDGDSDLCSSLESLPDGRDCDTERQQYQPVTLLTRTSSTSSLPCTSIEESWFLTPPPCFTSAGPIHMETSPLENLLIEHPSMSVYQHSSHHQHHHPPRRHNSAPSSPTPSPRPTDANTRRRDVQPQPRRAPVDTLRQQERQCLKIKNAQKLQIQKACESLKRGYFERHNKAREVNCRNHRQRRGERSQGSARSNANNNRKC